MCCIPRKENAGDIKVSIKKKKENKFFSGIEHVKISILLIFLIYFSKSNIRFDGLVSFFFFIDIKIRRILCMNYYICYNK